VQRATKVHDALCFDETKGPMSRMSPDVFKWRIGRELAAALGYGPSVDRRDHGTRHALTARSRLNVQTLQKCNR